MDHTTQEPEVETIEEAMMAPSSGASDAVQGINIETLATHLVRYSS